MTTADDDKLRTRRAPDLRRFSLMALVTGIVALFLGALVGSMTGFANFLHAYLVGFLLILGLSVGCLALGLLNNVVGGRWGLVIRPTLVIGAKSLPLVALLSIPLLLWLPANYPWARPEWAHDEVVAHQAHRWQWPAFFIARMAFYFACWIGLSLLVNAWGRRDERQFLPVEGNRRAISAPGIALFGVTATFAIIDLQMSLEPRWMSTVIGLLFIAGSALTALAFGTFVLWLMTEHTGRVHKHGSELGKTDATTISAGEPAHGPAVQPQDWGDLGNLMLAFTMLWAYMSFSQLLIQWAGNLPAEVKYFVPRLRSGWRFVALFLIVCHFAVPFFALLSRDVKRSGRILGGLAAVILVMRVVDWVWLVQPTVRYNFDYTQYGGAGPFELSNVGPGAWVLLSVLLPVGLGGIWLWFFASQLSNRVVLPEPVADAHGHGHGHGAHGEFPVGLVPAHAPGGAHAHPAPAGGSHGGAAAGGHHG